MEWQDYHRSYLSFELAVDQAAVVAKAAHSILRDFPRRLPKEWRAKVDLGTASWLATLQEFTQRAPEGATVPIDEVVRHSSDIADSAQVDAPGIVAPILHSYMSACFLGYPKHDLRFNEQVYVQQLVMTLAYLDAFMADSVQAICEVRPDVLRSSKKVEWDTIVSAGNWENLLQALTSEYVYQFGLGSLVKRIAKMKEKFGLEISLHERVLLTLEVAELARNVFVHNGGRINQQFIDNTQGLFLEMDGESIPGHKWIRILFVGDVEAADREEAPLAAGERLFCDDVIADGVARYAKIVAGELFAAVSMKFYGKGTQDLSGVTRQSDR